MATFNFAAAINKKGGGQDYGYLVDQLDIKRAQLEADGKLSPGDYDLLTAEAQKIYSHPALTPSQRSNVEVKIAQYKSAKSKDAVKQTNDIAVLNREIKDDMSKIGLRFSNDPSKFLEAQSAVYQAKVERLSQAINGLEMSGDDATEHYNELSETLNQLSDTEQALQDVTGSVGTDAPKSNFAAYIVTNSAGEVVDLKVQRIGAQSGYIETNGLYGGLPVYGKPNRKEMGKNIFNLGSQTFSANDVVLPGPDGSLKPSVLISSDKQKASKGGFSIAETGYTPIDLTSVRPQSAVRTGSWVESGSGFLYQRQQDGSYKKFVNYDKEKLGITDNDIITMPSSFEQGILKNVTETVDGAAEASMPIPSVMAPQATSTPAVATTTPQAATTTPVGRSQTGGAPTERAPQGAAAQGQSLIKRAGGFLAGLFGRGTSQ